uniref:Myotubularin phosphatase domain-containing protein n=1 Tax=Meloidogyne hapla TaxID=6305 RepID=A0A1I8BBQ0_MELHA
MELSELIEKSRIDGVFLCEGPRPPQKGSLALTGHHLIFSPEKTNWNSQIIDEDGVCSGKCDADSQQIDNQEFWIYKYWILGGIGHDYPFYYRCPFTVLDDGWRAYALEDKFSKLQLLTGERFRISSVNKDFESTIYRCGQPLIGPTSRRCKEDEVILNSMLSKFSQGLIYDTRTKLTAQTSRGRGGGCESQMYYSKWKYVNGNVPRIKDLHESLTRLIEACIENSVSFLSRLANCGWLQYITDTLTGAATVAQIVHCMNEVSEVPVLVHGGDGTDSTLLVTSLARLILDPDARTIRGFQSLIEDEWTGAGHPFSIRCAHSAFATGTLTGPNESPVFLCFLDCVWQVSFFCNGGMEPAYASEFGGIYINELKTILMRQYPSCLEFNEQFLIFLFEHAYASEFGTFLTHTVSLWSYVNHPAVLPAFLNYLYRPYDQPIWPSVAPQSIVLWERIYLRWQRNWSQFDRTMQTLNSWKQDEKRLVARLQALQQQQSEQSRSISACSTITSTEAPQHSNSTHSQLLQNEARLILPHNPFALENLVKMDHLNITSFDNETDGEGFEVVEDGTNNDGYTLGRRMAKTAANSSTASMLNGAKQTARQFLQKLGPSFI